MRLTSQACSALPIGRRRLSRPASRKEVVKRLDRSYTGVFHLPIPDFQQSAQRHPGGSGHFRQIGVGYGLELLTSSIEKRLGWHAADYQSKYGLMQSTKGLQFAQ